jgi:hypothetical protein
MRVVSVSTSFSMYQVTHAPGGARLQSCERKKKKMMGNISSTFGISLLDPFIIGCYTKRDRAATTAAAGNGHYMKILIGNGRGREENLPLYTYACE